MGIKLNVRTRIKINGKEYASVEDLPPELRAKYEAAFGAHGVLEHPPAGTRIVFNGTAYDSPEHMPAEVRKLYDLAVAATESGAPAPAAARGTQAAATLPPAPAPSAAPGLRAPGRRGASPKRVLWVLAAVLLVALWTFLSRHGTRFH